MTSVLTLTLISTLIYAWLSRMAGGSRPKLHFGLDQWFYALPNGVLSYFTGGIYWAVLAYATAFLGKRTGHGNALDYGTEDKAHENNPEKLEYLILWMKDKIPEYWYDFILMTITGLAVTLVTGLCVVVTYDILLGSLILLGGALKGVAYMIGWAMFPTGRASWWRNHEVEGYKWKISDELAESTQIGELLTGIFGTVFIFYTLFSLLILQ